LGIILFDRTYSFPLEGCPVKGRSRKSRIIILGGGFGGIACSKKAASVKNHEILLLDKNPYTTMLPSLPDVAGDRIEARYLEEDISRMVPSNIRVSREEVQSVSLDRSIIQTNKQEYRYDYLAIATGSVTNFYGFNQNLEGIHTLTSLEEGKRIRYEFPRYLERTKKPHVILAGAGYTALELAGALAVRAGEKGAALRITLVEKADRILPFLTPKQHDHIRRYMDRMGFRLLVSDSIEGFDGSNVRLHSGREFSDCFICWTAGTKFAIPQIEGDIERIPDGRIRVNENLEVPGYPGVFAIGDSAAINSEGGYLRKAVNFAVYSGTRAGDNIRRSIGGRPLRAFHPIDLGWVIPLHKDSVGRIFGKIPVSGRIGLKMHYFMCGFRNFNWKNALAFYKMALFNTKGGKRR